MTIVGHIVQWLKYSLAFYPKWLKSILAFTKADRAVNFENDEAGTQLNYEVISQTVSHYRKCAEPCAAIPDEWKASIEADYASRHRG